MIKVLRSLKVHVHSTPKRQSATSTNSTNFVSLSFSNSSLFFYLSCRRHLFHYHGSRVNPEFDLEKNMEQNSDKKREAIVLFCIFHF
jgi:hypothetical protein